MGRKATRRSGVRMGILGLVLAASALIPLIGTPPASGAQSKTGDVSIGTRYVFTPATCSRPRARSFAARSPVARRKTLISIAAHEIGS